MTQKQPQTPTHIGRWDELEPLLDELLDLGSAARLRRLSALERSDVELHTTLRRLLDAYDRGNRLLDRGAFAGYGPAPAAHLLALWQDWQKTSGTARPRTAGVTADSSSSEMKDPKNK